MRQNENQIRHFPTHKLTGGFSYIEVLIAMALFFIVLAAALPALSAAGRNLAYAQNHYSAHLQAQRMMLAIREALHKDEDLELAATAIALQPGFTYSFWVFGAQAANGGNESAYITADITSLNLLALVNSSAIKVVIWDSHGNAAGQAIGMLVESP